MNAPISAQSEGNESDAFVAFRNVSKSYGGSAFAVTNLDFSISRGDFLTLLGPSGSGKTTTLMMLAGFEYPSSGDILLRGRSLSSKPPHKRNMGIVFQNYALFPHMTVAQNLAFPLNVRSIRGSEAARRVTRALDLVHLSGLDDRRPSQLSGGQQQRVALARALIFEPDIVLMDEPLGALDRQLREHMQDEIKNIHRRLGITIAYVTHDQSEALAMSDRVAIFADGKIQQIDTPHAIYEKPANTFVASFVGENNIVPGVVVECRPTCCAIRIADDLIVDAVPVAPLALGQHVNISIRPEHIIINPAQSALANRFRTKVENVVFHGDHHRICARLPDGTPIHIRCPGSVSLSDTITAGWAAEYCYAFAIPETKS